MLSKKLRGFTLIELLTVIAIIFILAGLVLSVSRYVTQKGKTSRATAEIAGMSSACESYKADNGVYPDDGTYTTTYQPGAAAGLDPRTMGSPTATTYTAASLVLYRALSGDTNCDGTVNSQDQGFTISGVAISGSASGVNPTVYMSFKPTQLKTTGGTAAGSVLAIKDPWGYSYGYSTAYAADIQNGVATPTHGYNPTFDLWSTAGGTSQGSNTFPQYQLTWITNW